MGSEGIDGKASKPAINQPTDDGFVLMVDFWQGIHEYGHIGIALLTYLTGKQLGRRTGDQGYCGYEDGYGRPKKARTGM